MEDQVLFKGSDIGDFYCLVPVLVTSLSSLQKKVFRVQKQNELGWVGQKMYEILREMQRIPFS